MDSITCRLDGARELRVKLLALDAATGWQPLLVMVSEAAARLRSLAAALAPRKTGKLAAAIRVETLRFGPGYAHVVMGLADEGKNSAFYGQWQEYGLGTGSPSPPSARTLRRRSNFAHIMDLKRAGFTTTGFASGQYGRFKGGRQVYTGEYFSRGEMHKIRHGEISNAGGLTKREYKSLRDYESKGRMQGMRRPNMAAHPFMRPAVAMLGEQIKGAMIARLEQLIESFKE